jgi:prepilin-type N-terminal cleavage/methylation domain-containing protein
MRKAFTIIELMIVISIIAIIAAIAIPNIQASRQSVQDNGITAPERTVPADRMRTEVPTKNVPAERVIKDGGKMEPERK